LKAERLLQQVISPDGDDATSVAVSQPLRAGLRGGALFMLGAWIWGAEEQGNLDAIYLPCI